MEWRKTDRFPCYEVSEYGAVRRATKGIRGGIVGKVLKPYLREDGYDMYILREGNKSYHAKAHQLVAEAFIGKKPFDGAEVCHFDGTRTNDHYSNLRWDTRSGNNADKVRHGTSNHGEANWNAKITKDAVEEIKRRYKAGGISQRELGDEFGIQQPHVSRILSGKRWT